MNKESQSKQSTSAEITQQRINELPVHSEYKQDPTLPIPLGRSVLLKKIAVKEKKTKVGIILVDSGKVKNTNQDNVQDRKEGIICGVGPECSSFIKLGLRAAINVHAGEAGFIHDDGEFYYKCHEADVFYILPNEDTRVENGTKEDSVIRRERGHEKQERAVSIDAKKDGYDEDKNNDLTRGKVQPLPGMKDN